MKRSPLKRSAPVRHTPIRGGEIRRKKRTPSEYARVYGSKERVAWMKSFGCVVCLRVPAENAHTASDGMGRKAGYETVVPLCREHHRRYDQHQFPFDKPDLREALEKSAARMNAAWQSHLRQTGRARREETDNV